MAKRLSDEELERKRSIWSPPALDVVVEALLRGEELEAEERGHKETAAALRSTLSERNRERARAEEAERSRDHWKRLAEEYAEAYERERDEAIRAQDASARNWEDRLSGVSDQLSELLAVIHESNRREAEVGTEQAVEEAKERVKELKASADATPSSWCAQGHFHHKLPDSILCDLPDDLPDESVPSHGSGSVPGSRCAQGHPHSNLDEARACERSQAPAYYPCVQGHLHHDTQASAIACDERAWWRSRDPLERVARALEAAARHPWDNWRRAFEVAAGELRRERE